MRKISISSELMYALGIVAIALGTVLMERAAFGMSMVVAPAYIVYLKLSEIWGFFTFGMAEYMLQAFLIIALSIVMRRFKISYLMSFVTAVIYGFVLDALMAVSARIGVSGMAVRIACYVAGLLVCALGVACMFKTYLMPEAYELFVREICERRGKDTGRVKTIYDMTSCAAAIALSFAFFGFGEFRGVNVGTALCAVINGKVISAISGYMDRHFEFVDLLGLRRFM